MFTDVMLQLHVDLLFRPHLLPVPCTMNVTNQFQ